MGKSLKRWFKYGKKYKPVWMSGLGLAILVGAIIVKSGKLTRKNEDYFWPKVEDKLEINGLKVFKNDGVWWVAEGEKEIPADGEVAEATIKNLKKIKLDKLVSQNKNKFEKLRIGQREQVILKIEGKGLEIGDISVKYDGTYVRAEGEDKVYKIGVVLNKTDLSRSDYWRQKMLVNLPVWQIEKVVIKKGEKTKELTKDKWNDDWFNLVTGLKIEEYLPDFKENDQQTIFEFEVSIEGGEKKQFWLGENKEKKETIYWASSDKKHYWKIDNQDFDKLTEPFF